MTRTESHLLTQVLAYLAQVPGVVARRTNSGLARPLSGYGLVRLAPAGTPDITGHLPDGRALYIELKGPDEKPTQRNQERRDAVAAQERFIAEAAAVGCCAFTARSLDDVSARMIKEVHG